MELLPPFLRGELTVALIVPVLIALTVGIVGWTIVLTWIYNNTQSLFWIIVIHGWNNTVHSYLVLSSQSILANATRKRWGVQSLERDLLAGDHGLSGPLDVGDAVGANQCGSAGHLAGC